MPGMIPSPNTEAPKEILLSFLLGRWKDKDLTNSLDEPQSQENFKLLFPRKFCFCHFFFFIYDGRIDYMHVSWASDIFEPLTLGLNQVQCKSYSEFMK